MMRGKVFILLISILSVGCNYRKNTDVQPNIEVPTSYDEGTGTEVPPPPEPKDEAKPIRDVRWWRHMSDPTLSALIDEALRRNQGVRAGWARVNQARYIANQVRAARMPQIGVEGDYTIGKRSSQASASSGFNGQSDPSRSRTKSTVFARRAASTRAPSSTHEAARLDQEALAITISAEVAEAWFDSINARIESQSCKSNSRPTSSSSSSSSFGTERA